MLEVGRPNHCLRLLVGHANLLDSLLLELSGAEREQEPWFNQSVYEATKVPEKHHEDSGHSFSELHIVHFIPQRGAHVTPLSSSKGDGVGDGGDEQDSAKSLAACLAS